MRNSNTNISKPTRRKHYTTNDIKDNTGQKRLEAIRALSVIDDDTGCWEWGTTVKPRIAIDDKFLHLSRVAYIAAYGKPKAGMFVVNTCGNKLCINPSHRTVASGSTIQCKGNHGQVRRSNFKTSMKKLTEEQVKSILTDPRTQKAIAEEYGVSIICIGNIKRGSSWKHLSRPVKCERKVEPEKVNWFFSWLKRPTLPTISWS